MNDIKADIRRIFNSPNISIDDNGTYFSVKFIEAPIITVYPGFGLAEFLEGFEKRAYHGPKMKDFVYYLDDNRYMTNLDPIDKKKYKKEKFERRLAVYAERGMSRDEIAKKTGHSYGNVQQTAKRLGIQIVNRRSKYPKHRPSIPPTAISKAS